MAHPDVVRAVEARIQANFTRCTVLVENANTSTPDGGGPWILVDFPWCRSEWITANEFLEEGGFRVRLHVEPGVGAHQGRDWLEEIAGLFRGQAFDRVQCYAPQSPVTDDRSDEANYFRLELTVPYQFIVEG